MSDDPPGNKPSVDKKAELVLTPGGWRSKSKVYGVEPGQHVAVENGGLKVIQTETGKVIADLGTVGEGKSKAAGSGRPMKTATSPKSTK